MSSYILRNVDRDALNAFRASCAQHGLKPQDVLKAFIAGASVRYQIQHDHFRCDFQAVWSCRDVELLRTGLPQQLTDA